MIMMTMMLTSCDQMIRNDLEGTWRGDMYMVRDGYRAVYTEIEFIGDPYFSRTGTGNWLDVYSDYPGDYFCSRIDWEVKDRKIYIWLLDDRDRYGKPFELVIWDYKLRGDRFYGYVDYEGGSREFNLYRTSSRRWNDYSYGYWNSYDYGYSKGKKPNVQNDSIPQVTHTHEMRKD